MAETTHGSVYTELGRLELLELCCQHSALAESLARTIIDALNMIDHGDSQAARLCLLSAAARASNRCDSAQVWSVLAAYFHTARCEAVQYETVQGDIS